MKLLSSKSKVEPEPGAEASDANGKKMKGLKIELPADAKEQDDDSKNGASQAQPKLTLAESVAMWQYYILDTMRSLTRIRRSAGGPGKGILLSEEAKIEKSKRKHRPKRVHFRLPRQKSVKLVQPVEPDSRLVQAWNVFMVFPLSYEVWAFPYRLAFGTNGFTSITAADFCCDAFFMVNSAMVCSTIIPAGVPPAKAEPINSFKELTKVYFRRQFFIDYVPSVIYYSASFLLRGDTTTSLWLWWASTLPRITTRYHRLVSYFTEMGNDLDVNVKVLEACKFALIIFFSSHWVGCVFYFLARLKDLDDTTWIHTFHVGLLPLFSKWESPVSAQYLLCLYKGFNAISNLGYDYGIPRNWIEMVWAMIIMCLQVYLSALILGSLLNYLVRNDPADEAHKTRMAGLLSYAEEKDFPLELRDRILNHAQFQYKKNRQDAALGNLQLPKSLTVKIANYKYRSVLQKCTQKGKALDGCSQLFLDAFIIRLKPVYIEAGDEFTKIGDLPRELYLVVDGAVFLMDAENRIQRVIRSDVPDMPPIAGEVPFFVGIKHPHTFRAQPNGDVHLLELSKESIDELFELFPKERELIISNVLANIGLDVEGHDIATEIVVKKKKDDEGKDDHDKGPKSSQLKTMAKFAIKIQGHQQFAAYQAFAENGDLEAVESMIRQGMHVDQTDYDGRSLLHLGCGRGSYKLVEMLLENQADINLKDRWGQTPLAAAIRNNQRLVVELLEQYRADLAIEDPSEAMIQAAQSGDMEKLKTLIENGVDASVANFDGRTALHAAAAAGQEETVIFLISKGANLNAKDRWGGTPLKDAVLGNHNLLATIMRSKGAILPAGMGEELLCTAAGEGNVQTLKLLHECKENLNAGDYDARCPLHLAAAEARVLAVAFLLSQSADPNCTDRWGGRPIDDALRGGTLYHMLCGKLIASWGGQPGTSLNNEEGRKAWEELQEVKMSDALALVKSLNEKGYDKIMVERVSEDDMLLGFESSMQIVPLVRKFRDEGNIVTDYSRTLREQSEGLLNSINRTMKFIAGELDAVKTQHSAPARNKIKFGRSFQGSFVAKKGTSLGDGNESPLAGRDGRSSPGVRQGRDQSPERKASPQARVQRQNSIEGSLDASTVQGSTSGLKKSGSSENLAGGKLKRELTIDDGGRTFRDQCGELTVMLLEDGKNEDEEEEMDEVADAVDTDEEEELHKEIDRLFEAAEKAEELGLTTQQMAAAAFHKVAARILEISEMFATLSGLFKSISIRRRDASNASFTGVEASVTQQELSEVAELLQLNPVGNEIEEAFEEAQTYTLEMMKEKEKAAKSNNRDRERVLRGADKDDDEDKDKKGKSPGREREHKRAGDKGREAAADDGAVEVSLDALMIGSHTWRELLVGMEINPTVCLLLETVLYSSGVFPEDLLRRMEANPERTYDPDECIIGEDAQPGPEEEFFVVLDGELHAIPTDGLEKGEKPWVLKHGDVFGAFKALNKQEPCCQVVTANKVTVLPLRTSCLVEAVSEDLSLKKPIANLMGEHPECFRPLPKALSKGGSFKSLTRAMSVGKNRRQSVNPNASSSPARGLGMLGSSSKNLFGSVGSPDRGMPGVNSAMTPGMGRTGSNLASGPGGMMRITSSGSSAAGFGLGKPPPNEIQRKSMTEVMHCMEDLWFALSMGANTAALANVLNVGKKLGEVSTLTYKKLFLNSKAHSPPSPNNPNAKSQLSQTQYWECWMFFIADDNADEADEAAAEGDGAEGAQDEDEAAGNMHEMFEEQESFFDRLHARYSSARSLKRHFFDTNVLDSYEPAYEHICENLQTPLTRAKAPLYLSQVFVDFHYAITRRNIDEFFEVFSKDGIKGRTVTWNEMRIVLRERRMGMTEIEEGTLINSTLNPNADFLRYWRVLMNLCAVWYLVTVPVLAAFYPWQMQDTEAIATNLPVDLLVTLNLFLVLNTAYKSQRNGWITNRMKILRKTPIALIVSAIPLDWLAYVCGVSSEVAFMARIPKLALAYAVSSNKESQTDSLQDKIFRMISILSITLHFGGCIWFFLGRSYSTWFPNQAISWYLVDDNVEDLTYERDPFFGWAPGSTVWAQYLLSLFWVAATLTVNGAIGEAVPQNEVEIIFTIVLMVLNMTLFRWIIGEISGIIMNADLGKVLMREEYSSIQTFMQGNKLPGDIQEEIKAHYHATKASNSISQGELFAGTSYTLQVDTARYLYKEIVADVNLFDGCSEPFLDAICVVLHEVNYGPEEVLFHAGATAPAVYIVLSGGIEHVVETDRGEYVDGQSKVGDSVGGLAFFFGIKHLYSGRATHAASTTALQLGRDQFLNILAIYPEEESKIAVNCMKNFQEASKAMSSNFHQSVAGMSVASKGAESAAGVSTVQGSMAGSGAESNARSKKSKKSQAQDNQGSDYDDDEEASQASSEGMGIEVANSQKKVLNELASKRKGKLLKMLCAACAAGDLQMVKEILINGKNEINVNDKDFENRTALHVAASEGKADIVACLLELNSDVKMRDKYQNTPLNDAVRHKQDEVAELIRKKHSVDLDMKVERSADMLCKAAMDGDEETMGRLIANGIDVNAQNADGRCALHIAACEGKSNLTSLLLEKGADPRIKDKWGNTPLAEAVRESRLGVQDILRSFDVRLGEEGEMEFCVKMCDLASSNQLEEMKIMVANGIDISAGDYDMRTPLHLAASNEMLGVLEYMLKIEPKINVNPIDRFGGTPLEDAYRHENRTAIQILEKFGGIRADTSSAVALEEQINRVKEEAKERRVPHVAAKAKSSREAESHKFLMAVFLPQLHDKATALCSVLQEVLSCLEGLIQSYKASIRPADPPNLIKPKAVSNLVFAGESNGVVKTKGSPLPVPLTRIESADLDDASPMAALQAGWNITEDINRAVDEPQQDPPQDDLVMRLSRPELLEGASPDAAAQVEASDVVEISKKGDPPGSPKAESSGSTGSSGGEGTEASAANTEVVKDANGSEQSSPAEPAPPSEPVAHADGSGLEPAANVDTAGSPAAVAVPDPWSEQESSAVSAAELPEMPVAKDEGTDNSAPSLNSQRDPKKIVFLGETRYRDADPEPEPEPELEPEESPDSDSEDDEPMEDQNILDIMMSMVKRMGSHKPPKKFDSLSAGLDETQHKLKTMKLCVSAMQQMLDPEPYVVDDEELKAKEDAGDKSKEAAEAAAMSLDSVKSKEGCSCTVWKLVMSGYKSEAKQFKKQLRVQRETYKLLRRLLKELHKIVQRRQRNAEMSASFKR